MRAVTLCVFGSLFVSVVTAGVLEDMKAGLNEKIEKEEEKVDSLEKQVHAQASQLTKLTTPQYFDVKLMGSKTIEPGQVLVFDGVTDDPDHLYDSTTGEFKCKVPGMYVFTLNVMTPEEDGHLFLNIVVNGGTKALTHANGNWDQASQTVTVTLKAGDVVKVIGNWKESIVYGVEYPYSTFTGRLVTPAK